MSRVELWRPTAEEAKSILGKLPSVVENTTFTPEGLVESPNGLLVPAYVASGLGFNVPGRHHLDEVIYPKLAEHGIFPLCPFSACAEFIDPGLFDEGQSVADQKAGWQQFNRDVVGTVNYGLLMPRAKAMVAIMEGSPTDEGVAAEVAYFASNIGPVFGMRTDFRLAENPATGTNPAVTFFMGGPRYGGGYFEGQQAYEQAYERVGQFAQEIKAGLG